MTIVPNLFFIGIGVAMLWQIAVSPSGRVPQAGDPGPWMIPSCLAVLLVVLGLVDLGRHFVRRRQRDVTGEPALLDPAKIDPDTGVSQLDAPAWPERIIFVAALLGYVLLFATVGFTLSTMVFLFVAVLTLSALSVRSVAWAAGIGVVTSLGIGWLLTGVVGVPLPGVLFLD